MLTEADYLDHIRRTFPDFELRNVQINQEGMVNVSVIVDGKRVFRFPRTQRSVELQRHEMKVLDLLRHYVDMPVPDWDYRADEMVSYPYIPGEPLLTDDVARMTEREQDAVAEALAVFLLQVHSVPLDAVQAAGVQRSETARTAAERLAFYADIEAHLFPLMWADGREWVRRLFAPFLADHALWDYEPCFMLGDLGTYHLLFERRTNAFNGVIDFGTAGIGDPAADFAILLNQYGESFLRRMAKVYPEIGAHIERTRFLAGAVELEWVLRGIKSKDPSMFVVHLGRARDVMPVGSGW